MKLKWRGPRRNFQMEPKRSKYDTNPLDEDVRAHAEQSWGETRPGPPTEEMRGGATRDIGRTGNESARANPDHEAPTRRIDDTYPSVFAYGQPRQATYQSPRLTPQSIYQSPRVAPAEVYQRPPVPSVIKEPARKVAGLGIPEKWAVILPYLPFYLALIAAVGELLLVPRSEKRVRFHAAQGLVLQIGITAISMLLRVAGILSGRATGANFFSFAVFVFLIVSMVRVWKGKEHHIPPLEDAAKWMESRINPRKQDASS